MRFTAGGGKAMKIVRRFDYIVPGRLSDFDSQDFVEEACRFILDCVSPQDKVALSASGGVDSTTVAYLLKRCISDRIYPFFIDDGFRRTLKGREESEVTAELLRDLPNFRVINVRSKYFSALEGVDGGEKKRATFRQLYTATSNEILKEIGAAWVADGTIAPDIIETGDKVKTQHNVELPYQADKLEPLSSLYKPHVRKVAARLGVPAEAAFKIPCPGPAQLIRVVGPVNPRKLEMAKIASDYVERGTEEYCRKKWGAPFRYDEKTGIRTPFQMFGVCLDPGMEAAKDVTDFMRKATNTEIHCYKMKSMTTYVEKKGKRPAEPLYAPVLWVRSPDCAKGIEAVQSLQETVFERFGYPRILLEMQESKGDFPVAIRIVESPDAVTAMPMKVDLDVLAGLAKTVAEKCGASGVAYDLSVKPPATIEFE
jgi:GMP synthase (glutamine-hydrolysing)